MRPSERQVRGCLDAAVRKVAGQMTDNPPMPVRKIRIDALECVCSRCGQKWVTRGEETPVRCAKCGSVYWNRPYMRKGVKK